VLIVLSRRDTVMVRHYIAVTVRPILVCENDPTGNLMALATASWYRKGHSPHHDGRSRCRREIRRRQLAILAGRKEMICAVEQQSAVVSVRSLRQPSRNSMTSCLVRRRTDPWAGNGKSRLASLASTLAADGVHVHMHCPGADAAAPGPIPAKMGYHHPMRGA
jgi:hypothetical protein